MGGRGETTLVNWRLGKYTVITSICRTDNMKATLRLHTHVSRSVLRRPPPPAALSQDLTGPWGEEWWSIIPYPFCPRRVSLSLRVHGISTQYAFRFNLPTNIHDYIPVKRKPTNFCDREWSEKWHEMNEWENEMTWGRLYYNVKNVVGI